MGKLESRLEQFASDYNIKSKGKLALALFITNEAATKGQAPFSAEDFLSSSGGQISGLSRAAVQKILASYGIERVLAEEGGRTSRGSIERMGTYVGFLNSLANDDLLDLKAVKGWWIERIREFFASKPFKIGADASKSLRNILSDLIAAAYARQKECPGTMVAGAVMQHLVGAKLETALPGENVEHSGFSVADAPTGRKGDFLVGDAAIHVTAAPSEALIRKCLDNLDQNLRPLIVTTKSEVSVAYSLARSSDAADRIEVLEIEQFVAANVLERSGFKTERRVVELRELIVVYNRIVEQTETDQSLKIEIG